MRLHDMTRVELEAEISALPQQISLAAAYRDRLFARLRKQWSTAYVNDKAFIRAYERAEAAGSEVVYLARRTVEAAELWNERYSGTLI